MLVSLDLSATSDCVDHSLLLNPLALAYLDMLCLDFLRIYLAALIIKVGQASSTEFPCHCGVPQREFGTSSHPFFCLPTHQIVFAHNVAVQQYADDTQLFDAFSSATLPIARVRFEHCTADLDAWFRFNGLCLNISKFKAILLGTLQRLLSFPTIPSSTLPPLQ